MQREPKAAAAPQQLQQNGCQFMFDRLKERLSETSN